MSFTVDYSRSSARYSVSDGEYEVIIDSAGFDKTYNGTEFISLKLTVRSDVNQPERGEAIDYPLWRSRPENKKDSDIEGVPAWKIHQVSKAVGLPDGERIESADDWFRMITHKPMRVTTKQDEQGRAKVQRVEASLQPVVSPGAVVVDDEELPF